MPARRLMDPEAADSFTTAVPGGKEYNVSLSRECQGGDLRYKYTSHLASEVVSSPSVVKRTQLFGLHSMSHSRLWEHQHPIISMTVQCVVKWFSSDCPEAQKMILQR